MSVAIPHKPVLRGFSRSCGTSSHSDAALGDLVSTVMLLSVTLHRGVQALCLSFPKHNDAPAARVCASVWDQCGLGSASSQRRAGFPAQQPTWSHLSNVVMRRKKIQRRQKAGQRQKGSSSVMTLGRVSQGQPGLSKALVYRWHKMRAALAAVSGSAGGSQG